MRKIILCICGLICLCAALAEPVVFTDAAGNEISLEKPMRTVALLGSYGKAWLEAGGELAAITQDAVDAPEVAGRADVMNIGSHRTPNMETLFALDPDFVILSADTAEHADIGRILRQAGIPCAFFSAMDWRGYMEMAELFTRINNRPDRMAELTEQVRLPIEAMIERAKADEAYGMRTCLLLRAASAKVRSRRSGDILAGIILKDMGFANIADSDESILDNLSMEAILTADPDWIFVVPQGADTDAAMRAMADMFMNNPAWNALSAVKNGRFVLLPKDLFHLHPNARWAESYAYIEELIANG